MRETRIDCDDPRYTQIKYEQLGAFYRALHHTSYYHNTGLFNLFRSWGSVPEGEEIPDGAVQDQTYAEGEIVDRTNGAIFIHQHYGMENVRGIPGYWRRTS